MSDSKAGKAAGWIFVVIFFGAIWAAWLGSCSLMTGDGEPLLPFSWLFEFFGGC